MSRAVAVLAAAVLTPRSSLRPAHGARRSARPIGSALALMCRGVYTQVEAVSAASVPIAAREPRSRPRAEVCAPRSELAGKTLSTHLPFDLVILFPLAVHRTRLPLPPDGARPPLVRAHGHHFLEGAVAGGLLQHVPLPWAGAVGLDAREGGRTRVCLVRRRARERGLQRTPP